MDNKLTQHHYLPKNAYLKFFQLPNKSGFIWMYQRGKEPILANINKVAKERHLYSFIDENGQHNTEFESVLAEVEDAASKILEKLNNTEGPIFISAQEKSELAYFLAMQVVRTPAFRDFLKQQAAEFVKLHMQILASNKDSFNRVLQEVKKEEPNIPDVGFEKIQEFIFGEKYTIEIGDKNYFLKQAIQLGDYIYPTIMMKDISIVKSKSVEFITSDHPVILIPHPGIPAFYSGGFLMSGIFIPIGTSTTLFCKNPDNPKGSPKKNEQIPLAYREAPPIQVREMNKITVNHAERFLFGTTLDQKIKKNFDKTSIPKRFYIDSPFSRKKK